MHDRELCAAVAKTDQDERIFVSHRCTRSRLERAVCFKMKSLYCARIRFFSSMLVKYFQRMISDSELGGIGQRPPLMMESTTGEISSTGSWTTRLRFVGTSYF